MVPLLITSVHHIQYMNIVVRNQSRRGPRSYGWRMIVSRLFQSSLKRKEQTKRQKKRKKKNGMVLFGGARAASIDVSHCNRWIRLFDRIRLLLQVGI
jgi:hypothetical protein